MKKLFLLAMLPAFCFASANELVLVSNAAKGGTTISLDMVSTGNAAAGQFEVEVGVADPSMVDLTNCLSAVKASGRMTGCSLVGTKVIGLFASPDLKATSKGQVSLGSITVKTANAKIGEVSWESYDVAGNIVDSKVTNAAADVSKK